MKKLIYKEGNLLLAKDVAVIGHQANCQNTFGSGKHRVQCLCIIPVGKHKC